MSTAVTRQELAEIIGKRTLGARNRTELVSSIAAYLAGAHKSVDLDSLIRDVLLYRQASGIIEAVAVSAHELSPVVIRDIEALLKEHYPKAKTILVDQKLDPAVVGGVRIELPNEVLDLSVKSKLNLFKRLVAEERN